MAGFLYFRAGDARPFKLESVRGWGLGYAFVGKVKWETRPTAADSPSGAPGVVFADANRQAGKVLGYFKGQQTWRKLPTVDGRPELWVGYWNDAKPTPENLERPDMLPAMGSYVLGEGCRWNIATLTELDDLGQGGCTLPGPEDFDDEGNIVSRPPVGEDSELWDIVHPLALAACGFSDREPSHADYRAGAIALLKRNYVVDMPELAVMGALFGDNRYVNVIVMSCRGKWLLDAVRGAVDEEKKTSPPAESGLDTSAGAAA